MTDESSEPAEESEVTDFPHVAKLGMREGQAAAESLSAICTELTNAEVHTAVHRIRGIDDIIDDLPFPVIERLIAPERVLAELDEVQTHPVRRLHAWRNQLALLPLFITWVTLAFAVLARDRSSEFLGPTFAVVAFVDALLIGLVVLLTRMAHKRENAASIEYDRIAGQLDKAITCLAIAAENNTTMASPLKAEEWAESARRVIQEAMRETRELSEANRLVVADAANAVESARAKADDLIKQLAEQSRATLESLQQANEQMVTRVIKESVTVLTDAVNADRSLINDQMAPLVDKFRSSVEDFSRSFGTYQSNTDTFVTVTADLGAAANVLAESAKSYSDIAESIDSHLRMIKTSQEDFIKQVTESAQSMGTAAGAMQTMSTLLRDQLKADLERITTQLDTSSARLATVDSNLVGTTGALAGAATELQRASVALDRVSRRRIWPFKGKRPTA